MPPHDGCPCLRLALPTAKRVASFRQLLPNQAHKKSPPHFEMRRACNFISLRSLFSIYAPAFWARPFPGGVADSTILNIQAAIFQRPPRKNIESAVMIEQSLKQAKIAMIKKVMSELDRRILDKLGWKERSKEYGLDYETVANSFYANNKSTYPGLNYCLKENVKEDVDVCFRVEIENNIFCGYCTPKSKVYAGNQLSTVDAEKILNYKCPFPEIEAGWWLYWEYLPNEKDTANFKNANNAWYDLFDDSKFDKFIENCMKTIEKVLAMQK